MYFTWFKVVLFVVKLCNIVFILILNVYSMDKHAMKGF